MEQNLRRKGKGIKNYTKLSKIQNLGLLLEKYTFCTQSAAQFESSFSLIRNDGSVIKLCGELVRMVFFAIQLLIEKPSSTCAAWVHPFNLVKK